MVKILVVDDETVILKMFRELFSPETVILDTAEKIEEAENLFKTGKYDVIITDLRLSGMLGEEGLEIVNYIKEHAPQTKVILITGYGSPEIMSKAYAMGVDLYMEKPINTEALKGSLKMLGIEL